MGQAAGGKGKDCIGVRQAVRVRGGTTTGEGRLLGVVGKIYSLEHEEKMSTYGQTCPNLF